MRHIWMFALVVLGLALPAGAEGKRVTVKKSGNPVVVMKTNLGTVRIELYAEKAPITVENFLGYAREGFYDGTLFHRVIKGFMIQGGGYDAEMSRKSTKKSIKNEATNGLKNTRGTVAMARTSDPDSATAQFFINTADNKSLDNTASNPGYAVFGAVIEGMDVVEKIEGARTTVKSGMKDVPDPAVTIESIKVEE